MQCKNCTTYISAKPTHKLLATVIRIRRSELRIREVNKIQNLPDPDIIWIFFGSLVVPYFIEVYLGTYINAT
jgi:hypothetical protein